MGDKGLGLEFLENELERTKESIKDVDETIKKLTGREPLNLRPGQRRVSRGGIGAFRGRDVRQLTLSGIRARGGIRVRVNRDNEDERELEHDSGDEDYAKPAVQSSVIATPKEPRTREDLIKEQSKDTSSTARNRRMFGLLMGTLTSFKKQASAVSDRDVQRQAIEKKLEERAVKEQENLKKERINLFSKRRQQQIRLKRIEHKMELVKIHEEWEQQTNLLMKFIRTRCKPPIFWLPKVPNEDTEKKIAETNEVLQEIIEERRKQLAEEIEEVMHGEMNNDDIAALDDLESSKHLDPSLLADENFPSHTTNYNSKPSKISDNRTEDGEIVDESFKHYDNKENEASLFRQRPDVIKRHYRSRAGNDEEDDESKTKKHKKHDIDKDEREKGSNNRHKSDRSHRKSHEHRQSSRHKKRHSSSRQRSEHGKYDRKRSKNHKVDKSQEKSKQKRSSSHPKTTSHDVLNNEPEMMSIDSNVIDQMKDQDNFNNDAEIQSNQLNSNITEIPHMAENAMQKLSTDYPDDLPEPVICDSTLENKSISEEVVREEPCHSSNPDNSTSLDECVSYSTISKECGNLENVESNQESNTNKSENISLRNTSDIHSQEPNDESIVLKTKFELSKSYVDTMNEKEIILHEIIEKDDHGSTSKNVVTDLPRSRDVKKKSSKYKDNIESGDYEPLKKRSKAVDPINDGERKSVHESEKDKTVEDRYHEESSRNVKITSVNKSLDDILIDDGLIEPKVEIKLEPGDDDFINGRAIKSERTSEERELQKSNWKEIGVSENKRFVARVVKEKTRSGRFENKTRVKSMDSNKVRPADKSFFVMDSFDPSQIDDTFIEKKYSSEMKENADKASRIVVMKDLESADHQEHGEQNLKNTDILHSDLSHSDLSADLKKSDSKETDPNSSRVVIQNDKVEAMPCSNQSKTYEHSPNIIIDKIDEYPSALSPSLEKSRSVEIKSSDISKEQNFSILNKIPFESKSENIKPDDKNKSESESSSDSDSSQRSSSSDSDSESDTEQKPCSTSPQRLRNVKTKKSESSSSSSSSDDDTQSNPSSHSKSKDSDGYRKKLKHKTKNKSIIPEITMSSNNELVIGDLRMVISDVPLPPPKDI